MNLENLDIAIILKLVKSGKIIENFYLVFEVPTKYEEILENFIDVPENCTVHYKEISKLKKEYKR